MMLDVSVTIMAEKLYSLLSKYNPCMILYGSIVLDDFKLGWSDIDFLLLTETPLDQELAESLVYLRQTLTDEYPENLYFRSFEGAILSKKAFFHNMDDIVVYWGTSGERITNRYQLDPFSKIEILDQGKLLFGSDFRREMVYPARNELVEAIHQHYDTIRKYGNSHIGWLFDIARCLYTLKTNTIIAKTKAGDWAISEHLCPSITVTNKALQIRSNPTELLHCEETKHWMGSLKSEIQAFADVLQKELEKVI